MAARVESAVIWPSLIEVAKAKELLITGHIIEAHEAERTGLVNKVALHDLSMGTAIDMAKHLADDPGNQTRHQKKGLGPPKPGPGMGSPMEEQNFRCEDPKENVGSANLPPDPNQQHGCRDTPPGQS